MLARANSVKIGVIFRAFKAFNLLTPPVVILVQL